MKKSIDIISFGVLISYITSASGGQEMWRAKVDDIHDLVQGCFIEPEAPPVTMACYQVDALLAAIQKNEKINAIKAYRAMTNVGLKEAKDAVEKYWYAHDLSKEASIGDGVTHQY